MVRAQEIRVCVSLAGHTYACVIHSTTCNAQLKCGTKWLSNWKASLLCWASRGSPNRKLLGLRATSDYFSAVSSLGFTSPSGVQGENITEAVPESAEETAEELIFQRWLI